MPRPKCVPKLPENIRTQMNQFGLSPQQQEIIRLVLTEHLDVSAVAGRMNTTKSNIYNQIMKIRRKVEQRRRLVSLARRAQEKFKDISGQVLFMHSRRVKNKDIAAVLGIDKRKVADILYRNKGKRYVIPAPSAPKDSPALKAAHKDACCVYYRAFVAGNLSPDSRDGRDLLKGLALAGAGGYKAKKLVLSDRANILQVLAERGRARYGRNLLHISTDSSAKKQLSSVLERYFTRVGPETWKPVSGCAWVAIREAQAVLEAG